MQNKNSDITQPWSWNENENVPRYAVRGKKVILLVKISQKEWEREREKPRLTYRDTSFKKHRDTS